MVVKRKDKDFWETVLTLAKENEKSKVKEMEFFKQDILSIDETMDDEKTKKIKVKKIVQAIRAYDGKFRTGRHSSG